MLLGSGCDSIDRVVTSYTRGPQFESRHQQNFIQNINLPCVNWTEKKKNTEKETGKGPFNKILFI